MAIWSRGGQTQSADVKDERIAAGTIGGMHATPGSFSGKQISGVVSVFDPRVTYGGNWSISLAQSFEDHLGQNAESTTAGSNISLAFSGTSVSVIGLNGLGGGYADVYLDGVLQGGRVNTFAMLNVASYGLTGLNATDTTIHVTDASMFDSSGTIIIDSEKITYSGKTATTFTGCTRSGVDTHITSAMVYAYSSLINFYSPYHQSRNIVWANDALNTGQHTLKLVVRSDADPSATSKLMHIDGFNVGGIVGAANLSTNLDYATFSSTAFDANGVSSSAHLPIFTSGTNQQILSVLGAGVYSGATFKPCFVSYDPKNGQFWFYCPTGASSTLDVIVTILVAGASI
jgi:hypothetical protein